MMGRGYVKKGDRLAADYISSEFERAGLKKYSKTYFQGFTTSINTFPGDMIVKINGNSLIPGQDFLIDPGSPSISGKFLTVNLTAEEILQDVAWKEKVKSASKKIIIVEAFDKTKFNKDQLKSIQDVISFLQYSTANPSCGTIILTNEKLTWSGSTSLNSKPSITIKANPINDVVHEIELEIKNIFLKNYDSQNVIGYLEGEQKDSSLVYTAHYDHLGMMGATTMFAGANDNASGVAMLLSLVKYYTVHPSKYSIVFIAFGGEEIGLLGSTYFTEHPLFPLNKIKFLINFDMAGTGDEGIQVVNGKIHQKKFDLLAQINKELNLVAQVKIRGKACNSDHCMFDAKGVPCFFIYTLGGIQAYHDIYDKPQTLPFTDFEDYFKLVLEFANRI
jgi:hypothetical protein